MRLSSPVALHSSFILGSLAAVILIAAAQGRGGKPPADPHASGRLIAPPGGDEVAYCDGCHKTGCSVPHPERVKLSWPARGRTVLDAQGAVTCGSCHTRGFRGRADAFLARDQKGLCATCHFGAHQLSNAHTSSQKCEACHAHSAAFLAHTTPVETRAMRQSVNSECLRCHYDGPVTHPIGIPNTKRKAPDLPLAADGNITCVTCHVGHDQRNLFGAMLRKDNHRGGLCLSCHDDL